MTDKELSFHLFTPTLNVGESGSTLWTGSCQTDRNGDRLGLQSFSEHFLNKFKILRGNLSIAVIKTLMKLTSLSKAEFSKHWFPVQLWWTWVTALCIRSKRMWKCTVEVSRLHIGPFRQVVTPSTSRLFACLFVLHFCFYRQVVQIFKGHFIPMLQPNEGLVFTKSDAILICDVSPELSVVFSDPIQGLLALDCWRQG